MVNTSSITGLVSSPDLGLYKVTKHAVVTFSETLFHELKERDSKIGVSVLCSGWVNTQLADSERNRPNEYLNSPEAELPSQKYQKLDIAIRRQIYKGKTPEEIAEAIFQAIEEN
ncbi:MAG: SDR family NAD(P)-dependent oxidoreductase [Chloroflexi bacterium]|nr:SDR family NAD(P)-dependent oxidoreductase [Chloroflexota bacterium]